MKLVLLDHTLAIVLYLVNLALLALGPQLALNLASTVELVPTWTPTLTLVNLAPMTLSLVIEPLNVLLALVDLTLKKDQKNVLFVKLASSTILLVTTNVRPVLLAPTPMLEPVNVLLALLALTPPMVPPDVITALLATT